jgi:hypothetical protein
MSGLTGGAALGLARDHLAFAEHDRLDANGGRQGTRIGLGPRRSERQLNEPGAIPEIDEDQLAKIPASMHPAAQLDGSADVLGDQEPTGVTSQGRGKRTSVDPFRTHVPGSLGSTIIPA